MARPKVSVVMPAYNAERYVADAIESILNQTFRDFEFLIIDDCSKDGTGKIIRDYASTDNRIVFIQNERNLKIGKTLNKGIGLARGRYVCRMDADDLSYLDRLEKQVTFMERNPNVVISGGTMEVCDEEMNVISKRKYNLTDESIRKKLFRYSPFCHATTIYRREAAIEIGGYNELLPPAEDYDFYFRIGKLGLFGNLPDTLYKMRVNRSGASFSNVRRQEYLTLYIRLKAVNEYGYPMGSLNKIYFLAQFASMFCIPSRAKYWLFNSIRSITK